MVTRFVVLLLVVLGGMGACSDRDSAVKTTRMGEQEAPKQNAPQAQGKSWAVPQEKLATTEGAIKLTGTITVNDYASGLLQIDATVPVEGSSVPPQGVPPITVARYKTPGPYELYLPAGTEQINLALILDLKGNGPGAEDPKAVYENNPIKLDAGELTGIDFLLEGKSAELPPSPPLDGAERAAEMAGQNDRDDSNASEPGNDGVPPPEDALSLTNATVETGSDSSSTGGPPFAETESRQAAQGDSGARDNASSVAPESGDADPSGPQAPLDDSAGASGDTAKPGTATDPLDESLDTVPQ